MNGKLRAVLLTAVAICASSIMSLAQGTAITYQGRLFDGGNPANGLYDLQFSLFDAPSNGTLLPPVVQTNGVGVTNGLFTTPVDFGSGMFWGTAYWLQISVRTNGNGAFTDLNSALQALTPAPYSVYSENAGLAQTAITANAVAGGVIGPNAFEVGAGPTPGQVLSYNGFILAWTNVSGGGSGSGWDLTGNGGTTPGVNFLGTTDNQPLELHVNGTRVFRLEPSSIAPNVVGGVGSSVDPTASGATISGGNANTVGSGATAATIGGGSLNAANNGNAGTVGGGFENTVSNLYPTISGGEYNVANANGATIGGGYNNTASGRESTIAGGAQNITSGVGATVGGGGYNGTVVAGNTASGPGSTVAGGVGNIAGLDYATVGGGYSNAANGEYAGVAAGARNLASGEAAFIGGGLDNSASGLGATVPGGSQNEASGSFSLAAGDFAQALNQGAFVWSDNLLGTPFSSTADYQFSVRAHGGVRLVTGGNGTTGLTLDGYEVLTTATGGVGGGGSGWSLTGNSGTDPSVNFLGTTDGASLELRVNNSPALLLVPNSAGADLIGGSLNSVASGYVADTIAGGLHNFIQANYATIGGGTQNTNMGGFATVGGGFLNTASGGDATVSGGYGNFAGGLYATVPGGVNNSASGQGSFAAGQNAQTTYPGSFVWGDGTQAAIGTGSNRFEVLATGGVNFYTGRVGINTGSPRQALDVNGGYAEIQGNGIQAYIGGGFAAPDGVEIGSFNNGVTNVTLVNLTSFAQMGLSCGSATVAGNMSACSVTIRGGCDLAEPFAIANQEVPAGSVVIIDDEHPGGLKPSDRPYDTRVAGIVSGANGINPGISLHQEGALEGGKNVALSGRVYVRADTSNGPIKPGDLLTTSATPGRAMKVTDHARAQGAVLGKAMTALNDGDGMVLVLVTLQ